MMLVSDSRVCSVPALSGIRVASQGGCGNLRTQFQVVLAFRRQLQVRTEFDQLSLKALRDSPGLRWAAKIPERFGRLFLDWRRVSTLLIRDLTAEIHHR